MPDDTSPYVLLATWNTGKVQWMREALADLPVPSRGLRAGEVPDVEESGETCEENARLKASAVPARAGAVVVAEDSGLFVDALQGRPGTHTARWSPGSDDDRAKRLLELLEGTPAEKRTARFVSAVAIRFPDGHATTVRGESVGRILGEPGPEGTGYGGVFALPNGQLLSSSVGTGPHRVRALTAAATAIRLWLASSG